ncbi:MAG: hypothetical protein K0Q48_1374, partial [Bacillota bacterium]|nr:hypothetical protein [Bacillota bacterium]
MKKSKDKSAENNTRFWNNITSGIKEKLNIKEKSVSENENSIRDMGDTRTPFSRLDLTGLNRQQAKELIEKVIDERLEQISQIELTELKIDYQEKERQRAKAAERVSERRNRRKQKASKPEETIITEDGVYSKYKQISVFDIIQPESFPTEEEELAPLEAESLPLEGQLSISEVLAEPEAELTEALCLETERVSPASSQTEFGEIMSAQTEAIANPDKATGKKSKKSKSKKHKENQPLLDTLPVKNGDEEASSLVVAAITMAATEVLTESAAEKNMTAAE